MKINLLILDAKTTVIKEENGEPNFFLIIGFGLKRGGKKVGITKAGGKLVVGNSGAARKDSGFENQKKGGEKGEEKENDKNKSIFRRHWLIVAIFPAKDLE